jgi:hypothetical protein
MHLTRVLKPAILALVLLVTSLALAGGEKEKAGTDAAQAWLQLVDGGKYGDSWDQAAAVMKSAVTKDGWQAGMAKTRGPLGKLQSRKVKSAVLTPQSPNAPGEYVIVQYESSFENGPAAIETVTPMHEPDGKWRVAGYIIKPR